MQKYAAFTMRFRLSFVDAVGGRAVRVVMQHDLRRSGMNPNQKVNQIKQQANPQNRNVGAPSTTVTLKITPAPISMAVSPAAFTVKQGAKLEIPVTINRLYGFADPVPLKAKLPDGVSGFNVPQIAIAQGQNQAALVIEAAAGATPGQHKVSVQAIPKFNNQDLPVLQDVTLTVEKVEAAK